LSNIIAPLSFISLISIFFANLFSAFDVVGFIKANALNPSATARLIFNNVFFDFFVLI